MKKKARTLLTWVLVLAVAFLAVHFFGGQDGGPRERQDFSSFLSHAEAGAVEHVVIRGEEIEVTLKDSAGWYATRGHIDENLVRELSEKGTGVTYAEMEEGFNWTWAALALPLLLIVLFFVFLAKQQGHAGGIMAIGKSRARLVKENPISFKDVGGLSKAKEQVGDVIDFLKRPERWQKSGVRLPRGLLLVGPPGCGKTLLARAVAGEAGVPFYSVSASEFVEMFVGVGAARVRDMFDQARKEAPAIIFIDELDAVGRQRGSGIGSAHDEREQTLNQLLVSLDGFESDDAVVVVAATNRPDVLDKALLRPGRFDRHVEIGIPTESDRAEMLEIHTRNKKLHEDVSLEAVAARTAGYSGADLENLTNEATVLVVREIGDAGDAESPEVVTARHFERALDLADGKAQSFNKLDVILIESASQIAQPTGKVRVLVTLDDSSVVCGDLIWADGQFVKVREGDAGGRAVVIPKLKIRHLEAQNGTEAADSGERIGDQWAHQMHDLMT